MTTTSNPTGSIAVHCDSCSACFVHHGPPESLPGNKAAQGWIVVGAKDFCRRDCVKVSDNNPHQISGDELTRRTAEYVSEPEKQERSGRALRASNPDTTVRCIQPECRQVFTGPVATAMESLRVHGWHQLEGGRWACSQQCLMLLGRLPAAGPPKPVLAVPDASYQRARAVAKATEAAKLDTTANRLASPVLQPGEELPVPPPRGLRKA